MSYRSQIIYDAGNLLSQGIIQGATAAESIVCKNPSVLTCPILATGTTLSIGVKVHELDTFQEIASWTGDNGPQSYEFTKSYNYVQLNRTVGTDTPTVFAQLN
jgi:hypothetical protein